MSDGTTRDIYKPGILTHEALRGKELHPEAHLSPADLEKLNDAIYIGDPKVWMQLILDNSEALPLHNLPPMFLKVYNLLSENRDEIDYCMQVMKKLANAGDMNDPQQRYEYQQAEMRIMLLVKEAIKKLVTINPENSLLLIALNGARIFEDMFVEESNSVIETQLKRMRLEDNTFAIGLAEMVPPDAAEVERVKNIIMPDDCLSTGMTQLGYLERALQLGYRPDSVILPFTVATYAGLQHLNDEVERMKNQYGNFDCIIAAGGICFGVDQAMYLRDLDGNYQVGDMGGWGRETEFGYPKGTESLKDFLELKGYQEQYTQHKERTEG